MKYVDSKCPNCGAALSPDDGKTTFCQYCGAKLTVDDEAQNLNVANGEEVGYQFEKGRQRAENEAAAAAPQPPQQPKRKTWLWVLGWIFIFPLPLTLILIKKKDMNNILKYGIIAAAWLVYLIIGFAGMGSKSEGTPQDAAVSAEKNDSADIELDKTFSFGDIKFDINSKWKKTETKGIVVFNINDTYKLYATKTDYDKSLISIDDALDAYLINDETYTTEYTTDEREVDGNKVVLFSQHKKGNSGKDEYSRNFVTVCGDYSYNVYISAPEAEYNESHCIAFMNEILYTLQMPRMETPEEPTEEETKEPTEKQTEKTDNTPIEYQNALDKAESYLNSSAFSKEGLRDQLKFEKYSDDAINYALGKISVDWKTQAVSKAEDYLNTGAFSKDGLYDQLVYEKFTTDEANYGVNNVSANWNQEAVESAQNYLDSSSFSKEELYDQLIYEKFTSGQAQYGVSQTYK